MRLDLVLGGDGGGAAGGHLVTMLRGTAPIWSQHCRGGPEKYAEAGQRNIQREPSICGII